MTNNRNKNIIIWTLLFSLIFSLIAPNFIYAEELPEEPYNVDLITKAGPYVYIDHESETFKINDDGKTVLTASELETVIQIINDTNSQVQEYRSDFIIEENKFVPNPQSALESGSMTTMSLTEINKSKNFDYAFTWYGLKVYWSHAFVEKLKSNLGIYGITVGGFNLAMISTLNYFKIPVPNWLVTFVTVAAGVSVYSFIAQDAGAGVYLDCYMYIPTIWYPVKYKWVKFDGQWYYYDASENMVKGWVLSDKSWYFLDKTTGIMRTGWLNTNSKWYYLKSSGQMHTGWLYSGSKWYYLKPGSGDMYIGWLSYGGNWYYLNSPSGDMRIGWLSYGGKWYYLNSPKGDTANDGWQWISGKCYYFYPDGSMAVNTTINGNKVGPDGAWIP